MPPLWDVLLLPPPHTHWNQLQSNFEPEGKSPDLCCWVQCNHWNSSFGQHFLQEGHWQKNPMGNHPPYAEPSADCNQFYWCKNPAMVSLITSMFDNWPHYRSQPAPVSETDLILKWPSFWSTDITSFPPSQAPPNAHPYKRMHYCHCVHPDIIRLWLSKIGLNWWHSIKFSMQNYVLFFMFGILCPWSLSPNVNFTATNNATLLAQGLTKITKMNAIVSHTIVSPAHTSGGGLIKHSR